MLRYKQSIVLILITLFFSCKDTTFYKPFEYKSIVTLTENFDQDKQTYLNIRLSFAKAVSNALKYVEFRDYLLDISKQNSNGLFNEILFSAHYNDIVSNNKTFSDYINEAVDNEIKSIYGNDFSQELLKIDPLGVIKIPDIFYTFIWNTESFSPIVYAKT